MCLSPKPQPCLAARVHKGCGQCLYPGMLSLWMFAGVSAHQREVEWLSWSWEAVGSRPSWNGVCPLHRDALGFSVQ